MSAGAPTKYKEEFNEQAYKLCLLGATDSSLADFFDVCVDTINEWKKVHPEFSVSIKKGKASADAVIANSLFEKAKGCRVSKQVAIKLTTKRPVLNKDGEPTRQIEQSEDIEIVDVEEDLPPDTVAAIFWLKNRQPKEWRDKQEVELGGNVHLHFGKDEEDLGDEL